MTNLRILIEKFFLAFLRFFPAEFSKNITLKSLKILYHLKLIKYFSVQQDSNSNGVVLGNLLFKNRIGIAGGLDKNAEYFHILGSLGFGFIEVGTITLEPQNGNPKPRIFRFPNDKTLVNSLGFNNSGSVKVLANIKKNKHKFDGILGVSIGKSKNTKTKNAWQDYLHLMDYFYLEADYLAINISSPNTRNLRELSARENIEFLLEKISQKKVQLISMYKKNTPIFVKLSPDETDENLKNLIQVSEKNNIDGFISIEKKINDSSTIFTELNIVDGFKIGYELKIQNNIFIRIGKNDANSSFGLGFNLSNIILDYAYIKNEDNFLHDSHRVGFNFNLQKEL